VPKRISKTDRRKLEQLIDTYGAGEVRRLVKNYTQATGANVGRPPVHPAEIVATWCLLELLRDRGPNLRRRSVTEACRILAAHEQHKRSVPRLRGVHREAERLKGYTGRQKG
jgi:hypothetical protein